MRVTAWLDEKAVVRTIRYGRETISYEVVYSPLRQTLGIEVYPDQRVLVRAPVECPHSLIDERLRKRAGWVSRQIADFQRYQPRTPPRQFVSGETHLYLGRQYQLKVRAGEQASVRLTRSQLVINAATKDPERIKTLLQRWYRERAREVFHAAQDAGLHRSKSFERPQLVVRAMRSRWGSLSMNGTMTLNADLVRAPRPCIEYVVTHELCHLKHRDHDRHFFRLLDRMMPDWEARKGRLEAALI